MIVHTQKVMTILSSVLVLIGFVWPRVSGSTSGVSPRLIPPHLVGKSYTNSPLKYCFNPLSHLYLCRSRVSHRLSWNGALLYSQLSTPPSSSKLHILCCLFISLLFAAGVRSACVWEKEMDSSQQTERAFTLKRRRKVLSQKSPPNPI